MYFEKTENNTGNSKESGDSFHESPICDRIELAIDRLPAVFSKPASLERLRLAQDFWYEIVGKNYEKFGSEPSPMQIRAHAIVRALGIPSGQVSALDTLSNGMRNDLEGDHIIAQELTNESGVAIGDTGIVSSDFRDIFPDGLPKDVVNQLDPRTAEIFRLKYEHQKNLKETESEEITGNSTVYFRIPGGVDLFISGYTHHPAYQREHGTYLTALSKAASVICVEGSSSRPYGDSLALHFNDVHFLQGHFDQLMKKAVQSGFSGLFAEIDARNEAYVSIETSHRTFLNESFVHVYFEYILREYPALAARIGGEEAFWNLLDKGANDSLGYEHYEAGKRFHANAFVGDTSDSYEPLPTGFEFGQMMYVDALSSIKLHLIGKLMADRKIAKGPIIDFQGADHLSGKSFFIQYPEYAMEVVLRTLPELMAFRAKNGISDIEKELEHTDWPEVVRQIAKLAFAKTTDNPENIEPFIYDYLKEYGIDPEKVIPSDEEVQEIMEKTKRGRAIRKQGKERE